MTLISEIAKMLPVVAITIVVLIVGMMLNTHRATGLYGLLGMVGERLALVGILKFCSRCRSDLARRWQTALGLEIRPVAL